MISVGGFFASLKLVTDEDSFKKGVTLLNEFPKLLGKTALAAVGVGTAMIGLGASTANAMTKLASTAKQLGMNAMTLDNWQNAVRLAGGDADSFTSSIQNMNEAFRNLKIGEVKEDFIKATGMSGADFSKLQGMNNDQRLRTIWDALQKVQDPGKQQALISKIFGQGGVDLNSRLQLQGRSLGDLYNQAAAMNPNSQADYDAAIKGSQANESIAVSFENTIKKVGIEIEKGLLPALQDLAQWLRDNKDVITSFAQAIGQFVSDLTSVFSSDEKKRSEATTNLIMGGPRNAAVLSEVNKRHLNMEAYQQVREISNTLPASLKPQEAATMAVEKYQATRLKDIFPDFAKENLSDKILAGIYAKEQSAKGSNIFFDEKGYLGGAQKQVEQTLNIKVNGRPIADKDQQALYDKLMTMGILQ